MCTWCARVSALGPDSISQSVSNYPCVCGLSAYLSACPSTPVCLPVCLSLSLCLSLCLLSLSVPLSVSPCLALSVPLSAWPALALPALAPRVSQAQSQPPHLPLWPLTPSLQPCPPAPALGASSVCPQPCFPWLRLGRGTSFVFPACLPLTHTHPERTERCPPGEGRHGNRRPGLSRSSPGAQMGWVRDNARLGRPQLPSPSSGMSPPCHCDRRNFGQPRNKDNPGWQLPS